MANYHLEVQTITRSKGQSAVAAAAYRAGEKILDEKSGTLQDYTYKEDVLRSAILLPEGAPEAFADRAVLWNTVEAFEKRKDAQLAREINIALPIEFTETQNWDLITSFVQKEFVAMGMIADVAYHRGGTLKVPQPHAHVMLTLRHVDEQGFGQKARLWNQKALLKEWRAHWAEHCNEHYAALGFDIRIDHRTLEAQGINLEAQNKRGAIEAGQRKARALEHQAIARRNGERIAKDPNILLYALTRQQSTFTHHDIARFLNRNSADEAQFSQVYALVLASKALVYLGRDRRGLERFSTREMVALEQKMVVQAEAIAQSSAHSLSSASVEAVIARYGTLSDEQKVALRHITVGADVSSVIGFAGTGKSYMLGAARVAWEKAGYRVQGMTLSGIAAQNLEASSGIQSRTVASHQWYWERGLEALTQNDIVVVDEAGMLGSEQMANIVEEVSRAHAKLVLIGDTEQLQAIAAGAAFRAISERSGFVSLTDILRQKEAWQREASQALATGKTDEALKAYQDKECVHAFSDKLSLMLALVKDWDEARGPSAGENSIMLAHTRRAVLELNAAARSLRQARGELGQDCEIMTARGERTLSDGDRIYFLENESKTLQVRNGTLATIESIRDNTITARLDAMPGEAPRRVMFNLNDYNNIDLGYAATIHKAQGVTVDRAYVLASSYMDRHLSYVALSRHREHCALYYDTQEFKSFDALCAKLGRVRAKDVSLDYDISSSALRDNKEAALTGFELRCSLFEGYRDKGGIKEKSHSQDFQQDNSAEIKRLNDFKAEQDAIASWSPETTLWAYDEAKAFVGYSETLTHVLQDKLFEQISEKEQDALAEKTAHWYQDKDKYQYLFKRVKALAVTMKTIALSFGAKQEAKSLENNAGVSAGNASSTQNWYAGYDLFAQFLSKSCDTLRELLDMPKSALDIEHTEAKSHYESKQAYAERYQEAEDYLRLLEKHEDRVQREDEDYENEDIKAMYAFSELSKDIADNAGVMGALNDINPHYCDKVQRYAHSMDKEVARYQAKLGLSLEEGGDISY